MTKPDEDVFRRTVTEIVGQMRPLGPGRDPARIPVLLDELSRAWQRHPDLRFFQLLDALEPEMRGVDRFNHEDDILLAALRRFNAG